MIEKNDKAATTSIDNCSVLADSNLTSSNQPLSNQQETATSFETAEFDVLVAPQNGSNAITRPASKLNSTIRNRSKIFLIETEESDPDESSDSQVPYWESTYRGMPSWLVSMIVHLSIILLLALLTVSDKGKKMVDLLAASSESVEIEPYTTFDIVLESEEIEAVVHELESPESKLSDTTDLAPVLDEALLSAALESESQNDLFERISSEGVDASDLPRRVEGGGAQFFGVEGNGSDFVFVVDCSGSMADYGRWRQALRELKKSVKELKSNQRFLILLYNDGFIAMNKDAKLVKSTEREQKKAFQWLSRNRPDNWTFCSEALAKAISLKPDAIFLLSDGEFNDRQDVFFVLDSMNNKKKLKIYQERQIPVHTIALGSHQGRWTMKRIADENSGLFKLVE